MGLPEARWDSAQGFDLRMAVGIENRLPDRVPTLSDDFALTVDHGSDRQIALVLRKTSQIHRARKTADVMLCQLYTHCPSSHHQVCRHASIPGIP
jgi:hypothetical protein